MTIQESIRQLRPEKDNKWSKLDDDDDDDDIKIGTC
jgi:hypothetical protein